MDSKDGNMANASNLGNPPPYTAYAHSPPQVVGVVQPPTATIIHTSVPVATVVVGRQMGPNPQVINCKSCNIQIVTRVTSNASMRTHLFAALLCLLGCWPCIFVPYCMSSCNNADHYCPNCNAYIGSYII